MKFNSTLIQQVLFEDKIDKIKGQGFQQWLKAFCTVKVLLGRLLTMVLATTIFCVIYFVLRQNGINGVYGDLVLNPGSAFGAGSS